MVTGWLLSNILVAVAVLKALRISSDFILAFPCALAEPKALRSSSCCLAFLLFASLEERALDVCSKQKSPHCSCGLCDPVRIQT